MTVTRETIAAASRRQEAVDVPEWGGQVFVRSISLADRMRVEDLAQKAETSGSYDGMKATVLAAAVVDADGRALFTGKDDPVLLDADATVTERLFERAATLSGITGAVEDVAGES